MEEWIYQHTEEDSPNASDAAKGEREMAQPERLAPKRSRVRVWVVLALALAVLLMAGTATVVVFREEIRQIREAGDHPAQDPDSDPDFIPDPPNLENPPTIDLLDRSTGDELAVSEIYRRVSPSVVMIVATSGETSSLGTGIVLSEDGFLITNAHVVEGASMIRVTLGDQSSVYQAALIGSDRDSDVAVLKIPAQGLTPAVFGDSEQALVGEGVVAIGNPYSVQYAQTVTDGILSGIRKGIVVGDLRTDLLQHSALINPGNSGGPLINLYGQVIGMNSSRIKTDGNETYDGMGFSIPSKNLKEIVDQLMIYGYVPPTPMIGISVVFEKTEAGEGCRVVSVDSESDAYAKGLRRDDLIVAVNGRAIHSVDEFLETKKGLKVGDELTMTYLRAGQEHEITIQLQ